MAGGDGGPVGQPSEEQLRGRAVPTAAEGASPGCAFWGRSFYEQQLPGGFPAPRPAIPIPTAPRHDCPLACDVCVVGAGLAGLNTAVSLAERGLSVIVLEAEQVGWGASARNAGMAMAGFALEADQLCDEVGDEAARDLFSLSLMGLRVLRRRIEEHAIDCAVDDSGSLEMSFDGGVDALAEARKDARLSNDLLGTALEVWPADKARHHCNSPLYHHGFYDPFTFTVDPLRLTLGLALVAEQLGVRIYERTRACSLAEAPQDTGHLPDDASRRLEVRAEAANGGGGAERGTIRCRHVVLCGAAHLDSGLNRRLAAATAPVYTYIMVTKALPEGPLDSSVASRMAIVDNKNILNYYRRLPGNRLMFGALCTALPLRVESIAPALSRELTALYPQLQGQVEAEAAWGGQLAYTRRLMPLVGQERPGVWFATAFGGHGLNTTAMAGELIAGAIASDGGDTRYKLLQRHFAPKWEGGPFQTVGAVIAMQYYRIRDWLQVG